MYEGNKVGAILLMAGEGKRFGNDLPKQFHLLSGKRVYLYALETLFQSRYFDEILLVCQAPWIERVQSETAHFSNVKAILGGKTRQLSSYCGLMGFKEEPEIVLIHDAVRPFLTQKIINKNLESALKFGAVDTCIPSNDTIVYSKAKEKIDFFPLRSELFRGQTPQTFFYKWILEAHKKAKISFITNATDDCSLLHNIEKEIFITLGSEENIKITSSFDLEIAEHLLSKNFTLLQP